MPLKLPHDNISGPFSGDKILWHTEALNGLRAGENPAPVSVELDVTNVCNLNCPYCTNEDYRTRCEVHLNIELVTRTIMELAAMGVKAITFTGGGEPTMYPKLRESIELAKQYGLDVALISNGLSSFPSKTIVQNCTWVRYSVDAYDQSSYIQSKQVDGFQRVWRNIEAVVNAKKEYRSKCIIGIGILTDVIGTGMLAKTTAAFKPLGVDYIQFRPVVFNAHDPRSKEHVIRWDEDDFQSSKSQETESYRVYISAAKYRNMTKENSDRNYKHCTGVYFSCAIGATGDVWICCHMRGNKKFSIGNINQSTFSEIWNDTQTRNTIYGLIGNFAECMPLCRFHGQNTLLANINWNPQHVNFL